MRSRSLKRAEQEREGVRWEDDWKEKGVKEATDVSPTTPPSRPRSGKPAPLPEPLLPPRPEVRGRWMGENEILISWPVKPPERKISMARVDEEEVGDCGPDPWPSDHRTCRERAWPR